MANGCHYLIHVIVSELTFTVKEYIITYVMFICYECVYHVIKLVLGNQLDKDAETEEIKTYLISLFFLAVQSLSTLSHSAVCMAVVFQGHEHTHREVSRFQNTAKLRDKLILFMCTDDWRI